MYISNNFNYYLFIFIISHYDIGLIWGGTRLHEEGHCDLWYSKLNFTMISNIIRHNLLKLKIKN